MTACLFCCFLFLAHTSTIFGCRTDSPGFRHNNSFHILQENVTKGDIYQVHLQEYLCMQSDFCFIRDYIFRVGNGNSIQTWKNETDCPLQFPIKIIHMRIQKVGFYSGWNPLMVGIAPPLILKQRLQELLVTADMNKTFVAGVWNIDPTCWNQDNRSLKNCGRNFLLYEKIMNPPGSSMNLSSWILEPVSFLKGTFTTFYLHFSQQFFFTGMQTLLDRCCFKEIHIEGTKLQNVTIRNQKQLQTLYVRFTSRDYIKADLETMPQIITLSLPETTMATLPTGLRFLLNLTELDVSSNNLTSLPSDLLTSTNLQVLNVSNNNLLTLPFNTVQLKNLRVLNISRNKITASKLPQISYLNHLENVDLSYNAIQSIPEDLSKLKNLRELNLNYNRELSTFSFLNISDPFISLEVLHLSHTDYVINNGKDVLERVNGLRYLDISGNERFSWADKPFKFLTGKVNLTFLNVSGIDMNRIGCLGSDLPPKDGEFEPLLKLNILDLNDCNLQHLNVSTFTKLPSLQFLHLSSNKLTSLPNNLTSSLNNLKELDLSQNLLTSLHLYLPSRLVMDNLNLSHNLITSPAQIIYFGRVHKLDLSYNSISTWTDTNIFEDWVQQIDLSNNDIDFPTVNMRKSFEVLQSVDLNYNPIDCRQCRTLELQKWFQDSSPHNINNFTCAWPLDDKGKAVVDVKIDQLSCQKEQSNDIPLIISLTVLGTALLAATLLLYRYRLQVAYTVHAFGMKRRYKAKCHNEDKEYDAFVCYSGLDSSWVCNQLSPSLEKEPENYKFCIHERDFPVGTFIMRNIDSSIKKSRHTIVVLSNRFLTSSWCRWELELTNYTMIHEDRDLIIMVELENLDKQKIPGFLKFLMNTRTYLKWPRKNADQASIDLAWKKIRSALGDAWNTDNEDKEFLLEQDTEKDIMNSVIVDAEISHVTQEGQLSSDTRKQRSSFYIE